MNNLVKGVVFLSAIGGMQLFSSLSAAQSPAPGHYYAMPSWNQTFPGDKRFIVQTNFPGSMLQAVLDRETGLVWERSPSQDFISWKEARVECLNKGFTGRRGWRLPSVAELSSLIDPFVLPDAVLPPGHPFLNVTGQITWTATTDADDPTAVWVVDFLHGNVNTVPKSFEFAIAWCVRGGMNADAH